MSSRIFKYPLEVEHRQMVQMHATAVPYWVTEQNKQLVLYAKVRWPDPGDLKPRIFQVVTTGDVFEPHGKVFIGACTLGEWFQAFVFELVGDEFPKYGTGGRVVEEDDSIDMRSADDFRQLRREQRVAAELAAPGGLVSALFRQDSALRESFTG